MASHFTEEMMIIGNDVLDFHCKGSRVYEEKASDLVGEAVVDGTTSPKGGVFNDTVRKSCSPLPSPSPSPSPSPKPEPKPEPESDIESDVESDVPFDFEVDAEFMANYFFPCPENCCSGRAAPVLDSASKNDCLKESEEDIKLKTHKWLDELILESYLEVMELVNGKKNILVMESINGKKNQEA